jgi:hypothetical protein
MRRTLWFSCSLLCLFLSPAFSQTGMQVSPDQASLLEGESRTFQVLDCKGTELKGALWEGDGAISVKDADPVEVTAIHEGEGTVTATLNGVSSSAKIKVFAGKELPVGTIRWAVPPLRNCDNPEISNKVVGFVQATHPGPTGRACHLITAGMKRSDVEEMLNERGIALIGDKLTWIFHEANYSCEIRFTAPDGVVDTKSIKMNGDDQ